jgi:dTDP-4-amino-4,6-dideoxygalactose transaminase
LGPNTRAFEDEYAAYCGTQFCIGVGNGTDALHLALRAAGIGPGDEVITVSHTFIATIEAIELVGARPVLVDIDPRTFNIAPEGIERAITPRTKAIIPVHLYGRLADMDAILEIAGRRKLIVIEDASQSQGAIDAHGRRAGSIGHLGCFSFYYAKNLGAYGEAGAITTSDPELDRRIRLLRSHGESQRYEHEIMGFNCRPDEIQSAVLRIKLRHLDEWNDRRRQYAMRYHELLSDLAIELPELRFDGSHVYHQYVIRSSERDSLRQRLTEAGIGTGVHYPIPVHLQPAARGLGYARGDLPHTEAAASEVLSLPMFPELSEAQLTYVSEAVAAALQRPLSLA